MTTYPSRSKRSDHLLEFIVQNDFALIVIVTLFWLSAVGAIVGISWRLT